MTVPYSFANSTTSLQLSELDANFEAVQLNVATANTVVSNIQANITRVGNLSSLTVVGNTYANIVFASTASISGNITVGNINSGNVSGNYILGNGYFLSGISGGGYSYSNSNVASYLQVLTSNVSTAGNVAASYFIGNGSQLSGVTKNYSNSNVRSYLQVLTSNVSTAGNVFGSYILGNGYYLSGITGGVNNYSNSNVTSYLQSFTGNVSTTGNISGSVFFGNGSQLTGLPAAYGNANVSAYLPTYSGNLSANNISVSGNVTAVNLSGPIFATYSAANSSLTNQTTTVLKYNGILADDGNYYNFSNGQFTPQVPGWYQVNASMLPQYVSGTEEIAAALILNKNGSAVASGPQTVLTSTWGTVTNSSVSTLVYLNGTTDYLQILAAVYSNTGVWQIGASTGCFFQAAWIRGS